MVDDSHATGLLGPGGRGTVEHVGFLDRVDIITSTLGKALGGAAGGFTSGRKEIVDFLRHARGPIYSPIRVPPPIVVAALQGAGVDRRQRRPARSAA